MTVERLGGVTMTLEHVAHVAIQVARWREPDEDEKGDQDEEQENPRRSQRQVDRTERLSQGPRA